MWLPLELMLTLINRARSAGVSRGCNGASRSPQLKEIIHCTYNCTTVLYKYRCRFKTLRCLSPACRFQILPLQLHATCKHLDSSTHTFLNLTSAIIPLAHACLAPPTRSLAGIAWLKTLAGAGSRCTGREQPQTVADGRGELQISLRPRLAVLHRAGVSGLGQAPPPRQSSAISAAPARRRLGRRNH